MTAARLPDLRLPLAGIVLTFATAFAAAGPHGPLVFTALVGLSFFAATTVCFVVAPHLAVAATIPLFAFLPAVKVLAVPTIGPLKDAVTLAAALAVLVVAVRAREHGDAWLDRRLGLTVAFLLALYFVNIGGMINGAAFEAGWMHGVRLVTEPLILLLAGLAVGNPRTLRWSVRSLVATAGVVALYGIYQQLVGGAALVGLGYEYDEQVRTIGGRLRSFGTFDEPFAYTAFLLFALAATLFWFKWRASVAVVTGLIAIGLALAQVRSAAIVCLAFVGLWLARRRAAAIAAFVLVGVVVVGVLAIVVLPGATQTESVRTSDSTYLTVNGRTEAWRVVFERPGTLPLGQGVGIVGTAAERAQIDAGYGPAPDRNTTAVDSGYFAALADVGVAGVALILLLLARLGQLAYWYARAGRREGWLALALVVALATDALTRSSFTAFPTAYLGLLLIGVVLGAARYGNPQPAQLTPV